MNLTPSKLNASEILKFSDQWRMDAHLVDLDRAELSRHFNGGSIDGGDDQAGKPSIRRPNILLGFKFLERPIMQLLSTYDAGVGLIEAKVCNPKLPPTRRRIVEQHVNRITNQVIQRSERLLHPWKANAGEAVINGIGTLYRDDPYDWAPKYGRPYHDWDAPADITNDKFSDWCFLGNLTLTEILARLDRQKEVPDEDSYWDKQRLTSLAEKIAKRHDGKNSKGFQPLAADDPIAWREWVQAQSWGAEALASACPVVWFFSKRYDKENRRPIDLYCVPRWGEVAEEREDQLNITRPKNTDHEDVLFYQPCIFEDIRETFFPFQISCMIGGEPLMRRTMGLGALMYDMDIRIQTSINNMFEAQDFDFSPLFQASDQQSEMELQELAGTKIRPYDIMPSGAKFMDKPKGSRPYSSVFELTQLMSSEMGNQAQQFAGGGEFENKGRAELEVQVLERQQELTTALRLRMGDFIRRGDPLCESMGEVLINADLIKCDRAWQDRETIKEELKKVGVDWKEIHGHCTFAMRRPPGHGDPGLALRRAQQTEVVCRGAGPRAHRESLRNLLAAINGGDTQLAEELVPAENESQGMQEQMAMQQSATCLTTFMPSPVLETDNPLAHVPIHMTVLQARFSHAMEAGGLWTRAEQRGWEALAAHTLADIRALGAFNPQMAKKAEQGIIQMTNAANRFQISAVPGPVDPIEQAKLQLAQSEQQRKQVKTQDDMEHRRLAQGHREEAADFQQNLQLAQLTNAERDSEVNRSTKLAKTVSDIAEPATASTP